MSSAFGGLNAVAVFGGGERPGFPRHAVVQGPEVSVGPELEWPGAPSAWRRADAYCRAGMLAIAQLIEAVGPLDPEVALILTTRTGCQVADVAYHRRLVQEGAGRAPRRLFTFTLPGAPLCVAAIHWQLRGAQLALFGDHEVGDEEAQRWVRHGRAPAAVSLWCEVPIAGEARACARLWRLEP